MQTLQLVSEMLCGFKENRFPLRNNGTIWNHIIEKSHFEMPLIQISWSLQSYAGIPDSPMTGVSALLIELMEIHLAMAPLDRCTEAPRWESNVYFSSQGKKPCNMWMFPKIGVPPKWMVYNGKPLLKWMIWGYPYFRKPPCTSPKERLQAFSSCDHWDHWSLRSAVRGLLCCSRLCSLDS